MSAPATSDQELIEAVNAFGYTQFFSAALRHILAFNDGEDYDPESGISHLAHARANLGFFIELTQTQPGRDDRYQKDCHDHHPD